MFIKEVRCKLIKDSRKEKTIEVKVITLNGSFVASAPSGKSKGKNEFPDYNERGILYSLKMLNVLSRTLKNQNFFIKDFLGIESFEKVIRVFEARYGKIGANCIYALEAAFLKAAAKENKKDLWKFIFDSFYKGKVLIPMPVGNCIEGGMHSHSEKKPDFQEFLLIPNEKTISKAVTKNIHAYQFAEEVIEKKENKWKLKKTDESGFEVSLTNEETLEILKEIGTKKDLRIGIDLAASSFYNKGLYEYKNKRLLRDKEEQIDYVKRLIEKFNLFYVEDPLQEEDFVGFSELVKFVESKKLKTLIVGDDLTTTNFRRTERACKNKSINAIIIKPNQIGYLTEMKKVIDLCKKEKIKLIFSHRSGETMDNSISDFAIGFQADFVKLGIYGRERLIKLKRLIDIEKGLNKNL